MNLRVNLRYLRYLQLVVDHGSFAAAAQAGGVSQPAISHGMNQLQKAFEAPLFVRSGRRAVPTEAALQAVAMGRGLDERIAEMRAGGARRGQRDTLRVGATSSAALVCGPLLHDAWCLGDARRRLEVSSADEGRMLALLQGGELDLVISPLPRSHRAAGLRHQVLYQITPLAYARRGHPLARAHSLAELQAGPWAQVGPSVSGPVDVLQEAFAVRRLPPPRVSVSCPDYASLLRLLSERDLLAVLPHPALLVSAAAGQLVSLRLREALPRYEMHMFTRARPGPALRGVVAELAARLVQE